jgi:hypothetical protein
MSAHFIYAPMEIDHIIPQAEGGTDDEDNLWLACPRCNNFKRNQTHALDPTTGEHVQLFNPRRQVWSEHFAWSADGARIIGKTSCGRATVMALQLNVEANVVFREMLVSVGWHPPVDET